MSAGIYALGSFAGNPVDPADCRILGIDPTSDGFAGMARDFPGTNGTVGCHGDGANVLLFLGRLHDPAKLAADLGHSEAGPAEMALAALLRWGADARTRMPGEWSLLHWNAIDRRLQIATSFRLRDRVLIAQVGSRFAIAPSLAVLSRLAWIDDAIDPEGLAYELSPQRLRLGHEGHTVLRQVRQVEAGQFVTLDSAGKHVARRAPLEAIPWQGDFQDGVAAATEALRGIVRRAMAPCRRIGVLLSGGLDSTLIAAIAAEELRSDQTLTGFTSVAPPGSGLIDEQEWTQDTADHLGIELVPIWPADDCEIYRPAPHEFENGPTRSVRHYLYMALFRAAHERGVELMLDGEYGESALSRWAHFVTPMGRLRAAARGFRQLLGSGWEAPQEKFLARFAPDFFAGLPAPLRGAVPPMPIDRLSPSGPIGFTRGQPGFGAFPTADTGCALRRANPCLGDIELLRLVAGMPASFLRRDGNNRALIRAMLTGRVPEETRLRTEKRAFSPDYIDRLTREAPPLTARLDAWRAAGVGEILDLDWMARTVGPMSASEPLSYQTVVKFHTTAMAAVFLMDWRKQQ
ncbi:MAG: asparagine synthase-related protein [Sphingomonas sp.]|uniref:asparagine synthase-related protein n=1 Tax=Sphingomonas sp. TaxID=28214 RepID=UPI0035654D5D